MKSLLAFLLPGLLCLSLQLFSAQDFSALDAVTMAEAALLEHDLPQATQWWQQALRDDPHNTYLNQRYLETLRLRGKAEPAQAQRHYRDSITQASRLYKADVHSPQILHLASLAAQELGQLKAAEKWLRRNAVLYPDSYSFGYLLQFLQQYQLPIAVELVARALSYPWQHYNFTMAIAAGYLPHHPENYALVLLTAYEKWGPQQEIVSNLFSILAQLQWDAQRADFIEDLLQREITIPGAELEFYVNYTFEQDEYERLLKAYPQLGSLREYRAYHHVLAAALDRGEAAMARGCSVAMQQHFAPATDAMVYLHALAAFLADEPVEAAAFLSTEVNLDLAVYTLQSCITRAHRDTTLNTTCARLEDALAAEDATDWSRFLAASMRYWQGDVAGALELYDEVSIAFLQSYDLQTFLAEWVIQETADEAHAWQFLVGLPEPELHLGFAWARLQQADRALEYLHPDVRPLAMTTPDTALVVLEMLHITQDSTAMLQLGTRMVAAFPDDASVLNAVGYFIADGQLSAHYSWADTLLTRAREIAPASMAVLDSYLWLLYRMHRYDEAHPWLQEISAAEAWESTIAYHIGMLWLALGNRPMGMRYLQIAIDVNSDAATVEHVKKIIKEMQ